MVEKNKKIKNKNIFLVDKKSINIHHFRCDTMNGTAAKPAISFVFFSFFLLGMFNM